MARGKQSLWFPLLGLAFAIAGADKLLGARGYRRAFGRIGFTEEQMRAVGAAEVAGGVLVGTPATRKIGGAVLVLTSAKVLLSELDNKDEDLALARIGVLAAALTAFLPRARS
jgi:hypothetical protein